MRLPQPGTRARITQPADHNQGTGSATVVAHLPCKNCYKHLRAATTGRISPSAVHAVGAACHQPLGLLVVTDEGAQHPVLLDTPPDLSVAASPTKEAISC